MEKKIETRRLTESDSEVYCQSWVNRKPLYDGQIFSKPTEDNSLLKSNLANTLSSNNIVVIGNFSNNELIASVCVHLWKNLPYYTFYDFLTVKGCNHKFYNNAESLFGFAFSYFESSKRYTFYMMTKLRAFQKSELIKKNQMTKIVKSLPSFSRYNIYVEELISAGEKSNFNTHNELLRNQQWNCPILIRKGCLKQEFRNLEIKSQLLNKQTNRDVQL